MTHLPEPDTRQPTALHLDDQALQLIAAVEDAMRTPTAYRDDSPVPTVGNAPPVPQPGRPPMSQRATDASALMLSAGVASLPVGAAITGVLWASGHADPGVVALLCAAPTTLVLALSRLMRRAKDAIPDMHLHHHHYNGNVVQNHNNTTTNTRGVWAQTRNQLPK